MESNIYTSEQIDKYVLGHMSESERDEFEKKLSENIQLRKEFELQRKIILDIQRTHFRNYLGTLNETTKDTTDDEIKSDPVIKNKRAGRVKIFFRYSIAAAIIGICIIGLDIKYSSQIIGASEEYYNKMDVPVTRSGSTVDAMINEIYQALGDGEYGEIKSRISDVLEIINESLIKPVVSEEDRYTYEVLLMQKQDVEWYNALLLMKQGKVINSRKALNEIATSGGRYSKDAEDILNENYLF